VSANPDPLGGDTVERVLRIEELCDRFEDAWRSGSCPAVDDFLRSAGIDTATAPADLVRELARLEAAYRASLQSAETAEYSGPASGDSTLTAPADSPALGSRRPDGPLAPVVRGYELLEEVGRGGMGVVYRARDTRLGRDVAVKLLQDKYEPGSLAASRFSDEARITSQLQHPGIPPVHEVGELLDGRPYLVMKLINGRTLATILDGRNADTNTSAGDSSEYNAGVSHGALIAVFEQICQAVAYAHARKVIHRDLKPANVMAGAFGEVQVMDWGLAKVLSRPESPEPALSDDDRTEIRTMRDADLVTEAGSVLGTLSFMSPEQAQGAVGEIDERTDVFGLGAVLCTILTGQPPYPGSSSDSVRLKAIRGETADAFRRIDASEADPELIALCKRCLATNRETRPRDAGEVAKAVTAHLAAAGERARQAELDRVRAKEQRKRQLVQSVLAGAVLLLLVLAGFGVGLASLWQTAERAKGDAEHARDTAESARKGEADARQQVEREQEKLAVFEHGRGMQVAHQEWRDNNVARTLALLDSARPDLRGWEWHYLHRLCHSDLLTLKGHTGGVYSASWSPDGLQIVTAGHDGTARVWDAKSGTEPLTLKGHTSALYTASFSPDGSRVVTSSYEGTTRVWDARTGAELLTLKGRAGFQRSASFSPDGSRVIAGGYEGTAWVWDAKSGAELFTLKVHTGHLYTASWSPDGSRVVTSGLDGKARVWDAGTGAELLTLKGHAGSVSSASFSPDGSRVVTGGVDGKSRVWDAKSGAELLTLKGRSEARL
jgi:serine/threonine protein kinase